MFRTCRFPKTFRFDVKRNLLQWRDGRTTTLRKVMTIFFTTLPCSDSHAFTHSLAHANTHTNTKTQHIFTNAVALFDACSHNGGAALHVLIRGSSNTKQHPTSSVLNHLFGPNPACNALLRRCPSHQSRRRSFAIIWWSRNGTG